MKCSNLAENYSAIVFNNLDYSTGVEMINSASRFEENRNFRLAQFANRINWRLVVECKSFISTDSNASPLDPAVSFGTLESKPESKTEPEKFVDTFERIRYGIHVDAGSGSD